MDSLFDALGWQRAALRKQGFELVPTLDLNRPVEPDADYENLVRQGFGLHSLIHACISLVASSAAVPPLMVLSNGEHRPDSALQRLIDRPNPHVTRVEFIQLLLVHLLVSGNAYVELRRSTNGLVAEMGILRSDRMRIKPAADRAEDVFEYKVNQQTRLIPAENMIHFRLPNPGNDFYGLSPITVAAREGNLDIDATMFSRSFFENAGVPQGMMIIKGRRADRDEKGQIKKDWRNAFGRSINASGRAMRRFFDILVLNSSEAEYKELGSHMKDMEMEATRDLTESRICMPFRVPVIMAGAITGLRHATYANFEVAEKVFWRYGVAHFLEIVRARLELELVPEFQGSSGGGLTIAHDLSGVPALAEDNVAKLEAAAEAVRTGGYTPNQANRLLGLPQMDGGDFYVRSGLQTAIPAPAKITIIQPEIKGLPEPLEIEVRLIDKASAGLKQIGDRTLANAFRLLQDRIAGQMADDLEGYFDDQAKAVVAAMDALVPDEPSLSHFSPERKKIRGIRADDIFPADADSALRALLLGHYQTADEATHAALAGLLGLPAYVEENPVVAGIVENGSARVVQINEATKAALNDVLITAEQRGYSLFNAANGVPADNFVGVRGVVEETYKNRHLAIARTESAFATTDAAKARYREAGITEVDIIDGDQDAVCADRNGTRAPVDEPELAHPNCTLVLIPVVPIPA